MTFSQEAWNNIQSLYDRIIALPFNQELMQGVLDPEKFKFYVNQDSLYLKDFGRSLAILGGRSLENQHLQDLTKFAQETITVEGLLHRHYFEKFGVQFDGRKSPACFSYTHFLLSTTMLGTEEEAMAAVLPCFWIYYEVGHHIHQNAAPDNPYQEWIDTYAGEEYAQSVKRAIAIMDEMAQGVSPKIKTRMLEQFEVSTRLEHWFWDSAYELEWWR